MKKTAQYTLPYLIFRRDHLPADFPLDVDFEKLVSGIFLPAECAAWWRKSRRPARVILLFPDTLMVATHPTAPMASVSIPLGEIIAVETRRLFPEGRLTVHTAKCDHEWTYDVHAEGFATEFKFQLRQSLLVEEGPNHPQGRSIFGEPLDYKFGCAEADNLDRREPAIARFFSAPSRSLQKSWIFKRHVSLPGDYLAVTARRILWATDRFDGMHQPSGIVSSYAPLRHMVDVDLNCMEKTCEIDIELHGGILWRVPIQLDFYDEAESFIKQVRRLTIRDQARQTA
jgi:hypothetical protein